MTTASLCSELIAEAPLRDSKTRCQHSNKQDTAACTYSKWTCSSQKTNKSLCITTRRLNECQALTSKVSELNYDEIPKALDEVPDMFGVNYYKLKPGVDDGRIPLLRDVFMQNPGIHINIDLKGGDDDLMEQVYKLIVEFERQDITYFGDMNEAKNVKALKQGQQTGVRTFASIKYTILVCCAYFCCVLQCLPFRHWSFWYPFFGPDTLDVVVRRFGNSCRVRLFACIYRTLTWCMKPMFWHLRRRGVLVMFWNVNSEAEYNRALTYSIDGLLTDRPEFIRSIADKRINKNNSRSMIKIVPNLKKMHNLFNNFFNIFLV